jgi:hypothetical protein
MRSPSATFWPFRTEAAERWRYDVSYRPSALLMLTVRPEEPAVPAKRTSPPTAATTGVPGSAAMSIPRC